MSYANVANVQAMLPLISIASNTVPTTSDVQQFIDQRSAEIDAALGSIGLSVPLTTPSEAVTYLTQLNTQGAAADVWRSAWISSPGIDPQKNADDLLAAFEKALDGFRTGTNLPSGVAIASTVRAPRSFFTDNYAIGPDSNDTQDAWGDAIHSNPTLRRDRVY